MDRGPLPPHERTWRHPSELAAEERAAVRAQTAAPSTRVFALTTGTLGLLAVGVLILTITPRRLESPIAISATTTPLTAVPATTATADDGDPNPAAPRAAALVVREVTTTDLATLPRALATPIGDRGLALITRGAPGSDLGTVVEVMLPSGRIDVAEVVGRLGDTWMVELPHPEAGARLAPGAPSPSDMVIVMASPPITVAYADVTALDLYEGTAVLDRQGRLVGLCTRGDGTEPARVLEVSTSLVGATNADR